MPAKSGSARVADFRKRKRQLGFRLLQFYVRSPDDPEHQTECMRASESARASIGARAVSGTKEPLADIREIRKTMRGKVLSLSQPSRRRDRDNLLLCVQSDLFHATASVIVVPLQAPSRMTESELRVFVRTATASGYQPMVACIDEIDTIHENEIGAVEGVLTEADMDRIDHALLVVMGLTQRLARRAKSETPS